MNEDIAAVYRWRYIAGVVIVAMMLTLGYAVAWLHTDTNDQYHLAHLSIAAQGYEGVITEPPVLKDKTVNALINITAISAGDTVLPSSGKVLAAIARDKQSEALHYGDKVIFHGVVKEYDLPKNPDEFDYRQYQALHHIYHRVYLRNGTWQVAGGDGGNVLLTHIYAVGPTFSR